MQRKGGAFLLVAWAHRPKDPSRLFEILADTRDDELEVVFRVGGVAGMLAWAELGKRRHRIDYGVAPGEARPWVLMGIQGTC